MPTLWTAIAPGTSSFPKLLVLLLCVVRCAAHAAEPVELPSVTVIGTTPLPGVGLTKDQIPAPVQTGDAAQIERSNAIDLTGYMYRFLGSVYVNDIQNNPFQPDINYRGYTASPLLGTPQGLSVYMDGVRLNQPFGDVVSWDLIPRAAISSFALMPGSNPLFGLNTLGGALSIQTKDGVHNPGTSVQGYYGSNARWSVEFEQGGSKDNGLNWYFTGNYFSEDGWRDDSPSRVGQIFGKVGWQDATTTASLTAAYADTDLTGNGLQEQRFLARDYASVYTKPDNTDNRSLFLNLAGQHNFSDHLLSQRQRVLPQHQDRDFQRRHQRRLAERKRVPAVSPRSRRRSPPPATPASRPAGENAVEHAVPVLALHRQRPAQFRTEREVQRPAQQHEHQPAELRRDGAAHVAWNVFRAIANQFTAGAAYDASNTHFTQSSQFGYLNPDRSVTGVRRVCRRHPGLRERRRHSRRPRRADVHLQHLCNGHADAGQGMEPDAVGPLQPHDGREPRQSRAGGRARFAGWATTRFRASIPRSA